MEIQNSNSQETIEFTSKLSKLTELIRKAFAQRTPHFDGEKFLTNVDVCKYLHISQRTLQDYRDTGKIGYIQISGKILYKESEIIKLLEDNYVPAQNKKWIFSEGNGKSY